MIPYSHLYVQRPLKNSILVSPQKFKALIQYRRTAIEHVFGFGCHKNIQPNPPGYKRPFRGDYRTLLTHHDRISP